MNSSKKKIAIIGGGVSGLTAAYYLNKDYDVYLFEKNNRLGGHTRTIEVSSKETPSLMVDTGFIVMNHKNYPNFSKLLKELGVELQKSCMTFSYYDFNQNYGYAGISLSTLFPKFKYLFNLKHYALVGDLIRFGLIAHNELINNNLGKKTLGDFLDENKFCPEFQNKYLFPMGAAIWSSPATAIRNFPAKSYLQFFENHGLLRHFNRPQWYTVMNGANSYIKKILPTLSNSPRCNAKIARVEKKDNRIKLELKNQESENFDSVIFATHADTVLSLLERPATELYENLRKWEYQDNKVILHKDSSFMPKDKKLWASWNFLRLPNSSLKDPVNLTYYMNRLQNLKTKENYFVTLNPRKEILSSKIISSTVMSHPQYNLQALDSQENLKRINGEGNIWFCGSYMGYGFHEDAVSSAINVVKQIRKKL